MTENPRARLADIAEQAGVSEATVSRVLNDRPGVSLSTRQAVLTALDVLGYERPIRLRGRSGLVGLIVPELENPIFPAFAQVMETLIAQYGYTPVVGRDRRAARQVAQQLRAGSVNVNEGYAAAWGSVRAPMGGMGDSGLGRRHGDEGLLDYTQVQSIATQRALGFGAPAGWSDERWGTALLSAVVAMKRLGLK